MIDHGFIAGKVGKRGGRERVAELLFHHLGIPDADAEEDQGAGVSENGRSAP